MSRYVIQSARTHQFLHFNPATGDVGWSPSLITALQFGVAYEPDEVRQLLDDHCERGLAVVIDIDGEWQS